MCSVYYICSCHDVNSYQSADGLVVIIHKGSPCIEGAGWNVQARSHWDVITLNQGKGTLSRGQRTGIRRKEVG